MKKIIKWYILPLGILILSMVAALFVGSKSISVKDIITVLSGGGSAFQKVIIFQVRIPRIIAAASTGAALSVSGYLIQNNLNNTLASPGILGINNGAGLFVLLFACLFPYHYAGKCFAAFIGALLVTTAIYILASVTGMSKTSIVLSGVAFSALCLSVIDIIISLKPETVADRVAFQIGGFNALNINSVKFAVPFIIIILIASLIMAPSLDILMLGDDVAGGLGLNIKFYRAAHILFAALLSGAAVSMCGIIGFMGLIVPNVVRLFYRGNSRGGIFLCMVIGASFLTLCDLLGRSLVYPYELPCGLFLSLIGAPFLVWILIKKRKRLGMA